MPIKVSCTCGAAFAAKDELAGKTLACPKCQQPLTIPSGAAPAPRQPAKRPAAASAPQAPPASSVPTIFDDAGMKAKQHTGQVCPSCYHPMKQGAIICVHCGYSLQLGRKMEMQIHGRGAGGHGEAAELALQRAANMLEDDKREEKKKTSEGVPWWAYLLMFLGACSFLATMMLIPQKTAMTIAGFVVIGISVLLANYGYICILVVAFREHIGHGLGCLFFGLYAVVYSFMRWDLCAGPFLIWLASIPIAAFGFLIVYLATLVSEDDTRRIPLPPRSSVAAVQYVDFQLVRESSLAARSRSFPSRAL